MAVGAFQGGEIAPRAAFHGVHPRTTKPEGNRAGLIVPDQNNSRFQVHGRLESAFLSFTSVVEGEADHVQGSRKQPVLTRSRSPR